MKTLFDQTTFGNLQMKNRLVRSATGENLATSEGHITEDLQQVYIDLAKGGTGLIIFSFTSVAAKDHFNDGLMRLHDDALIPEYQNLLKDIHSYGAIAMPQLAMGIYKKIDETGNDYPVELNQMTKEDIEDIIDKFVGAAIRAKKAGFDGVELHGCHGFVLNSFLGPASNHRRDEYGGSLENRARMLITIIEKIKEKTGEFHVSIKMSGGDLPPQEMLDVCKMLVDAGLDSLEYEGYFSKMVALLQQELQIPVILTGGHRDMEQMEMLLNQHSVEYFGMSRPLIREPELPNNWKSGSSKKAACISCGMCMSTYGYRCALVPSPFGEKKPRNNR